MTVATHRFSSGRWLTLLVVLVALMTRKQADWGSAKGTRRAHVARSYRVLLNVGDNLADFVDEFRGTEAERLKVMEEHRDRWGREWIMLANPTYGSFETATFGHDLKLPAGDKRKAKRGALDAWPGPRDRASFSPRPSSREASWRWPPQRNGGSRSRWSRRVIIEATSLRSSADRSTTLPPADVLSRANSMREQVSGFCGARSA